MNLSELTTEQISMFCNKFNCSLDEFKPSYNGVYYLRMFSGIMGPQPEFHVTETSCIGINYYKNYNLTEKWINFLNSVEKTENTEATL